MAEKLDPEARYPGSLQTALDLYKNETGLEGDARLLSEKPPEARPQTSRKKRPKDPYRGYLKLCLTGLVLIAGAFLTHFTDPIQIARDTTMTMNDGSYLFRMWQAPPIKLYIKIFIFNITNAESFSRGRDKKIRVEEIGPYTYSEVVTNEDVVWNENGTISFTPLRNIQFEEELSVGDPSRDLVTVPNIPLLGIASMLHNSSTGLNLAVSTLVSYLNAQPILQMPIKSFLWGYDDPLVKLAQNTLPSWINFQQFGLLDRMMDEGVNRITMTLSNTNETKQFSIQRYNGLPGLGVWGYKPGGQGDHRLTRCNSVQGTSEGYLFQRDIAKGTDFVVYRKAFCRPLKLVFDKEDWSDIGYPIYSYKFADDILDPANPDNACYCKDGSCLPKGLSDLSPCYYNFPVAISLPHFFNGDKSLSEAVEGLSPDPKKHDTVFHVQPDVGVPVYVKTRIQLNLVVKKTKYIPRVRPFNNLVIPVFWMQVELHGLPLSVNFLMVLLLRIGPAVQRAAIVGSFLLGLGLVFVANLRYVWQSGIFNRRRTLISHRQKQTPQQGVIWRSPRYSSLLGQLQGEQPLAAGSQEARTR